MTTTTYRRTTTTAIVLAATAALTVGPATTAAHAQRSDTGGSSTHAPTAIDDVVAFRKAQQAQYLVDHGLVGLWP